jgi:predicted nucleic acid-binding Zn ribbon protein
MEQIKFILNNVIKNIGQKQEDSGELESAWRRCIKKSATKHTKISFFKNGILYINAENSAWLYELNTKKDEILLKLQKFTNNKIKSIKFKVGDINGE